MRVLFTNMALISPSGTVAYLLDLGPGLRARGCQCAFFSPRLGPVAERLRESGFEVTADPGAVCPPDIIHGQHTYAALRAAQTFPEASLLYVCHDRIAPHDAPPPRRFTDAYGAVDRLTTDRIVVATGVSPLSVFRLGNGVDTHKFAKRDRFRRRPSRALIYSGTFSDDSHFVVIRDACAQAGLALDEFGTDQHERCDDPATHLGDYDIIFAKARCAMEAMATGAQVILVGDNGVGPPVSLDNVRHLRTMNFGRQCLTEKASSEVLLEQIRQYDRTRARAVCEWVRLNLCLEGVSTRALSVYRHLLNHRSTRRRHIPASLWEQTLAGCAAHVPSSTVR